MDAKEKFKHIFRGLNRAFGQTKTGTKTNDKNKKSSSSFVVKREITDQDWEEHLNGGINSIGIIPINEDNLCAWGAIDIDSYDGFDHKKIITKLFESKLPLVVCRSKSGGAHVFLFVKDEVPAKEMHMKLKDISVWLGYAQNEIFPKQFELNESGTGNFLNLPYNDPNFPTRYAFNDKGERLSLEQFVEYYDQKVVNNLNNVVIPETHTDDTFKEDFKHAPPCLTKLCADKLGSGQRNEGLFQIGIYLRQRFPDELEAKLLEYNAKYCDPQVNVKELQNIFKQVSNDKKYFFKCNLPLFASVCNKERCKQKKFGVGKSAEDDIYSLTKYQSKVPFYEVTVNGKLVELSKDVFRPNGWDLFSHLVAIQTDYEPYPKTKLEWHEKKNELLADMREKKRYVNLPSEVTREGELLAHVQTFIDNTRGAKSKRDIRLGQTYEENGYFMFKTSFMWEHFSRKKYTIDKGEASKILMNEFDCLHDSVNTSGDGKEEQNKTTRVLKVPIDLMEREYEIQDPGIEKKVSPY